MVGKFHGKRDTKLYSVWSHFKGRCYNLNDHKYSNYGGRGIEVCDEWRNNFQAFYDWSINNGYKEGLTIDRIDVDGDYEPNNCRWVDQKTQQNNRRNNTRLTYNGKTQTISQWASELSVNKNTISTRHKRGYTDEECLFGKESKHGRYYNISESIK